MKVYVINEVLGKNSFEFDEESQNITGITFRIENSRERKRIFVPWTNVRCLEIIEEHKDGAVV